jgi:hypothetical protein
MERKRFSLDDYNKKAAFEDATKFFIVYEAEKKELKYFETFNFLFFETKKATILHVLEKDTQVIGSQPKKLIERAKCFIENPPIDLKITPTEDDKFRFVLDVDEHPIEQFPELENYCKNLPDANIFISNFCFEVWLYFHLDNQEEITSETSSQMKTELGLKHTEEKINNYPKGYLTPERIKKAIARAENADVDKNNYFPVAKSTKVYLLIQELLEHSILNEEVKNPETI